MASSLNMVHLVFQLIFWRCDNNIYWLFPHPTINQKNYWGETSIFNLQNTLVTFSFLLHFICSVARQLGFTFILLRVWVKNPYVKKCHLLFRSKPSHSNIQHSSSLTFVDLLSKVSPVKVWRWGLIRALWHTWSIWFAAIFLHDRLCWWSYFPPRLHLFGKQDNGERYRIFTRS